MGKESPLSPITSPVRVAGGCDDFLTPVPIRKHNEDSQRGTGYDYECDNILTGLTVPMYNQPLRIAAPFSFQVAGHDPFLKADGGLICKPVVPRELWFYLNLQRYPHFVPFISEFLGCVEFSTEDICRFAASVHDFDTSDSDGDRYITPWAEKLHQGHLERMTQPQTSRPHRYLILRDLTAAFHRPCIMDLKMGQRAYGDDATDAKKASQTVKSKRTTSFATGLRVCGCQGYSVEYEEFWQMHKYEGRKLTKDNLPLAFERFFHNGRELRRDVIDEFLQRLRQIEKIILKQEFRFYSTSLLLVYDAVSEAPSVELKMIDFSHTFLADGVVIDDGYLFGLRHLIGIMEGLLLLQAEDVSG